jgi:hypothetical protein
MNHSGQLRVPQELYEIRRKRFRKLLDLHAPDVVIAAEAELLLKCFKWSWSGWWHSWRINHFPQWLLWLTMTDYRQACKDYGNDEFERDLREKLHVPAKED